MDKIIDQMQTRVIQLIITDLKETIQIIELDIEDLKTCLFEFTKDDDKVKEIVNEIFESESKTFLFLENII